MAHRSSIGMHTRQDGVDQAGGNRHNTYFLQRRQAWEENDNQYQHTAQQYYNEDRQARNERDDRVRPDSKFTRSEQDIDVDNSDDISRDTMSMKNTAELFQKLEDLPTLIQNAKQEMRTLKQSLSAMASDETLKLKQEIETLRLENQSLKTRDTDRFPRKQDEDKMKNLVQELQQAREEIDTYKSENTTAVLRYREATEKIKDIEKTLTVTKHDLDKITTDHDSMVKKMSDLQKRYQTANDERGKMEKELSETKTRLSRLMGNKLGDNNPDIADLSDKNRPTKLAEKNTELYDNEWTDAFEVFESHYHSEKRAIDKLLQMLQDIKDCCDKIAKDQEGKLKEAMKLKRSRDSLPDHAFKQLKDFRRLTAEESLPEAMEQCMKAVQYKDYFRYLGSESVRKFFEVCVELCWFMNVQDPPLVFGDPPTKNDQFDSNIFKHYTATGSAYDYMVWPALFLKKDGALLSKGVAQASKEINRDPQMRRDAGSKGVRSVSYVHDMGQHNHHNVGGQIIDLETTTKSSSHGNSDSSSNRDSQDIHNKNYEQFVVGASDRQPDKKGLSHTVKERESKTVANRMSKHLSSSQRESESVIIQKQEPRPATPNSDYMKAFKNYAKIYGINSPMTVFYMGKHYDICKNYYLYNPENKSNESNA